MTTMEVIPSMTTMEVLATFRYLVDAELRKRAGGDSTTFREGCQEGYISSISDRYGTVSDQEAEKAYDNKETWIHVVPQIVAEDLGNWEDTFKNLDDLVMLDFDALNQAIHDAVTAFALRNPRKLHNALKYL